MKVLRKYKSRITSIWNDIEIFNSADVEMTKTPLSLKMIH